MACLDTGKHPLGVRDRKGRICCTSGCNQGSGLLSFGGANRIAQVPRSQLALRTTCTHSGLNISRCIAAASAQSGTSTTTSKPTSSELQPAGSSATGVDESELRLAVASSISEWLTTRGITSSALPLAMEAYPIAWEQPSRKGKAQGGQCGTLVIGGLTLPPSKSGNDAPTAVIGMALSFDSKAGGPHKSSFSGQAPSTQSGPSLPGHTLSPAPATSHSPEPSGHSTVRAHSSVVSGSESPAPAEDPEPQVQVFMTAQQPAPPGTSAPANMEHSSSSSSSSSPPPPPTQYPQQNGHHHPPASNGSPAPTSASPYPTSGSPSDGIQTSVGGVNTPGSVTPPVNSVTRATLEAHWGVTKGPGRRWRAPPAGWHTRPQESRDAGSGAWQTSFETRPVKQKSTPSPSRSNSGSPQQPMVEFLIIQMPLTDPLEEPGSGLALALRADGGKGWLKHLRPGGRLKDIFFPVHSCPCLTSRVTPLPRQASPSPEPEAFSTPKNGSPPPPTSTLRNPYPANGVSSNGNGTSYMSGAPGNDTAYPPWRMPVPDRAGSTPPGAVPLSSLYGWAGITPYGTYGPPRPGEPLTITVEAVTLPDKSSTTAAQDSSANNNGGAKAQDKGQSGTAQKQPDDGAASAATAEQKADQSSKTAEGTGAAPGITTAQSNTAAVRAAATTTEKPSSNGHAPNGSNGAVPSSNGHGISAAAGGKALGASNGSNAGGAAATGNKDGAAALQPPVAPTQGSSTPPPILFEVNQETAELELFILAFERSPRAPQDLAVAGRAWRPHGDGVCWWMVDEVANREGNAQRSLMHRFNQASELLDKVSGCRGDEQASAAAAVVAWLRLSAQRLLVWNRNYNVKPREISQAQDGACSKMAALFARRSSDDNLDLRSLTRLGLLSIGRGGQGDVGQRIRDEILEVQHRNRCKGGMMEEWHQKLHNNTSPDDVVICQALMNYCSSGLDISAYWSTLKRSNITRERLASFDRPIRSEPRFTSDQVPGLLKDLGEYLITLQAVHCGTDLASAAANVMGYNARSMKGGKQISVSPVPGVATPQLGRLLAAALHLQTQLSNQAMGGGGGGASGGTPTLPCVTRFLELLLEARHLIRPAVLAGDAGCGGRHRDVLFLDLALDGSARAALEGALAELRGVAAQGKHQQSVSRGDTEDQRKQSTPGVGSDQQRKGLLEALADQSPGMGHPSGRHEQLDILINALSLALEGAMLSSFPNEDLASVAKWLPALQQGMNDPGLQRDRALQALSLVDRLKRTLADTASTITRQLQPTAEALGSKLGVDRKALATFSEEVVRSGPCAPLSQLVSVLEPCLRHITGGGDWQVVGRGRAEGGGGVTGHVVLVPRLEDVQYSRYNQPTVLLVDQLSGHEEVPEGCVAVLSLGGACPDMLSHSAVRARNMDVLLAACYDEQAASSIRALVGSHARVTLQGQKVTVNKT